MSFYKDFNDHRFKKIPMNITVEGCNNCMLKAKGFLSAQAKVDYAKLECFIENCHKISTVNGDFIFERFRKFISDRRKLEELELKKLRSKFAAFLEQLDKTIGKEIQKWYITERKAFEIVSKTHVNMFEYFGDQEGHYRDFLIWLLNPNRSHGLDNKFTKMFINYIADKYGDHKNNYKLLTNRDFTNIEVKREDLGIDFIIIGSEFYCAVEMKLRAKEHNDQLKNYVNVLKKNRSYRNKNRQFKIYLDPKIDPENPYELSSDKFGSDRFKPMDWWQLTLLLTKLYNNVTESFTKAIIGQFIAHILIEPIKAFHNKEKLFDKKWKFELKFKKGDNNV